MSLAMPCALSPLVRRKVPTWLWKRSKAISARVYWSGWMSGSRPAYGRLTNAIRSTASSDRFTGAQPRQVGPAVGCREGGGQAQRRAGGGAHDALRLARLAARRSRVVCSALI